jgi:hypothetical protein
MYVALAVQGDTLCFMAVLNTGRVRGAEVGYVRGGQDKETIKFKTPDYLAEWTEKHFVGSRKAVKCSK